MSTFERTICFVKEPKSIRRIPWDLLSAEGYPFMISPAPVAGDFDSKVQTAAFVRDVADLFTEDNTNIENIDEVTGINWFNSEEEFYAMFDGVNAYYKSDPSAEFGYPRT